MLFAGSIWWDQVAGARETGPFNPHFVQDVGAAFAVAGPAMRILAGGTCRRGGSRRTWLDPSGDDRRRTRPLSMAIDGDKIAAIYLVRNPGKLRHVVLARQ